MVKDENGKKVARYPYKNLSNIQANKALSQAIATGIRKAWELLSDSDIKAVSF